MYWKDMQHSAAIQCLRCWRAWRRFILSIMSTGNSKFSPQRNCWNAIARGRTSIQDHQLLSLWNVTQILNITALHCCPTSSSELLEESESLKFDINDEGDERTKLQALHRMEYSSLTMDSSNNPMSSRICTVTFGCSMVDLGGAWIMSSSQLQPQRTRSHLLINCKFSWSLL